jgi:hypothetical protein
MLIKDKWDQMNQARERRYLIKFEKFDLNIFFRRDSSSPNRTLGTSPSMAQFLQLTIALDKLADRLSTN